MHLTVFLSQLNRRRPRSTGGFFVCKAVRREYIQRHYPTSGEIGAHAMHPPGKRIFDINK